jgi:2',3'-cyclic-nucleotide 2'-phosphodiesterase (5'-nucleotidase family)
VPIVQAGWASRYVGRLVLRFDGGGKLVGVSGAPVLMGGARSSNPVPEDQGLREQIRRKRFWGD